MEDNTSNFSMNNPPIKKERKKSKKIKKQQEEKEEEEGKSEITDSFLDLSSAGASAATSEKHPSITSTISIEMGRKTISKKIRIKKKRKNQNVHH